MTKKELEARVEELEQGYRDISVVTFNDPIDQRWLYELCDHMLGREDHNGR